MLDIIGIRLAVPCAAIIILIYENYILSGVENRFALNAATRLKLRIQKNSLGLDKEGK